MKGYFIVGTDTGVGKTWCATGLLAAMRQHGDTTLAMKPVAAGCEQTGEGLRNDDAMLLMQAMSEPASYAEVNPYAFAPPMAPHLAAQRAGVEIDTGQLVQQARYLAQRADRLVIEGAGGWLVPLGETASMADLVAATGLPVILVVGIRLGCINHALLTAEAIRQRGLVLAGWVANTGLDAAHSSLDIAANIESIAARLPAPLLGSLPRVAAHDAAELARYIDISLLA